MSLPVIVVQVIFFSLLIQFNFIVSASNAGGAQEKDIKYWISIHHVASVSLKEEPSDAV